MLRCYIAAFKAIGGAPRTILYDRMKTAVECGEVRPGDDNCDDFQGIGEIERGGHPRIHPQLPPRTSAGIWHVAAALYASAGSPAGSVTTPFTSAPINPLI